MDAGREICGETTGRFNRRWQARCWNETAQQIIKEKKEAYKWQKSGEEEDRKAYKQNKRQTKKEVAKAEQSSWEEWQRRLKEPKQRIDLFRIAKHMKR